MFKNPKEKWVRDMKQFTEKEIYFTLNIQNDVQPHLLQGENKHTNFSPIISNAEVRGHTVGEAAVQHKSVRPPYRGLTTPIKNMSIY